MNNPTGCPLIDKISTEVERIIFCLDFCPYSECVINTRDDALLERRDPPEIKEITLICSHCGAMETGTLINGRLERMAKWQQRGDKIYHIVDCGECK